MQQGVRDLGIDLGFHDDPGGSPPRRGKARGRRQAPGKQEEAAGKVDAGGGAPVPGVGQAEGPKAGRGQKAAEAAEAELRSRPRQPQQRQRQEPVEHDGQGRGQQGQGQGQGQQGQAQQGQAQQGQGQPQTSKVPAFAYAIDVSDEEDVWFHRRSWSSSEEDWGVEDEQADDRGYPPGSDMQATAAAALPRVRRQRVKRGAMASVLPMQGQQGQPQGQWGQPQGLQGQGQGQRVQRSEGEGRKEVGGATDQGLSSSAFSAQQESGKGAAKGAGGQGNQGGVRRGGGGGGEGDGGGTGGGRGGGEEGGGGRGRSPLSKASASVAADDGGTPTRRSPRGVTPGIGDTTVVVAQPSPAVAAAMAAAGYDSDGSWGVQVSFIHFIQTCRTTLP